MIELIPHGLMYTGCWISHLGHIFNLAHVVLHCTTQFWSCGAGHVVGIAHQGPICQAV